LQDAARLQSQQQWATDPLFENTTLLLQADNAPNAAQNNTFLDSSANAFTITRNGNTTQGTFTPFSATGWGNFFNGTTDFLSLSQVSLTGDFTIEAWLWFNTGASNPIPVGQLSGPTNKQALAYSSGFQYYQSNGGGNITGTIPLGLNQWIHLAVSRVSGTVRIFTNGALDGSTADTSTFSYNRIGCIASGVNMLNGYISNLRVLDGTGLYTTSFTPSTIPLTAITNTNLLTCQSNRFVDNSASPLTLTVNGTPSVQAFAPFAPQYQYTPTVIGGSGYFDGNGDSLSSATNFESATNISTFTIEGFVYPTTFSTLINVIGGMVVSSGDTKTLAAEVNTSGQVALYWFDGAVKRCTGNSVMQLNAWNYFAIVVTSNAIAIYVNKTTADTLSGTTTLTNRTQSQGLGVGAYFNNGAPAQYFNGYLANLRYSTVARTISAVPTAPFTPDTDARWLLNFTNAAITDGTMKNNLETVGNAQVSTSIVKYGTGSMAFDGSGDYLTSNAATTNLYVFGTGDFTIEFWIYSNSFASSATVFDARPNGDDGLTTPYPQAYWDTSGRFGYYTTTATRILSSPLNTNTWYHIAIARANGATRMFVNGVQAGSTYTDSNNYTCGVNRPAIGGSGFSPGSFSVNGYIDDLRITKGVARYTANFTPPQVALPRQ